MRNSTKKRNQPRIFIGLHEITNIGATFARAFQALGFQTFSVMRERNPYFTHEKYDVVIKDKLTWISGASPFFKAVHFVLQELLVFIEFIRALFICDVFIFIYGSSFFFWSYFDYWLLKQFRKKIISVFCGCDIRHWSAFEQEFESLGLNTSSLSVCTGCDGRSICHLRQKVRTVQFSERYSNLILSQRTMSQLLTRPYMRINIPLVLDEYEFNIPARDVPVVIHAPTNRTIKGTDYILAAVDRLKREGVNFDFRIIEQTSNLELRKILTNSDVVVDFLFIQTVGVLALEAMATGNAVLSSVMRDYELIPGDCPVIAITQDNVYENLKHIVLDKTHRMSLAIAGRKYVETYHDYITVTKRILNWLEVGGIQRYDYYPDFAEKHYRIPEDLLKKEKFHLIKDIQRFLHR
ncbi:MAG: hypothetical protein WC566_07340 [Dehalococcoidia bacterium]